MNEAALSKKIAQRLRKEGAWARKIAGGPTQAGLPDILACSKGVFIGLEVKLPGREKTLTTLQSHTLQQMRDAGGVAMMITSVHQLEYVLRLAEFASRFTKYVITEEGHWLWTGSLNRGGYGEIAYRKSGVTHRSSAHRISAAIHLGLHLDDGKLQSCHTCDLPACVNPAHLWLGTQKENLADMKRKGRSYQGDRYWLPNNKKFTNAQEDLLLKAYEKGTAQTAMAERLGIRKQTMGNIIQRARARRLDG